MTKPTRFLSTLLGEWHTEQYIAAVIDDLSAAEQAVKELEQAGWKARDVRLEPGQSVTQRIDKIEGQRSAPARIAAAVRGATSEEGPISTVYKDEARRGHQLLAVYANEPEQVERARCILTSHQAHAIEYFGSWVITDLSPQKCAPPGV